MTVHFFALAIDAEEPRDLARFWAGVLGWVVVDTDDDVALLPNDDTGFRLRFPATQRRRTGRNGMHLDLTSVTPDEQRETVARARSLGGQLLDVGQGSDAAHVVLADPDGNAFCVLTPR